MSRQIPAALRAALERELDGVGLRALRHALTHLTSAYRGSARRPVALSDEARLAYAVVRMPATFAAMARVLDETAARFETSAVSTLLDIGTGPGTAVWAAEATFPGLTHAVALDRDAGMLRLAERLRADLPRSAVAARWHTSRAEDTATWAEADLVTLSYVVGELGDAEAARVVQAAFAAARAAVVIVEPGTPRGYRTILDARDALIRAGGSIAAPCPHARACPLTGDDWCHFAARLERTKAHRMLKEGELAWEDEKFSYVVMAKDAALPAAARILRHPRIAKGRIDLRLCTVEGLADLAVTRRDEARWRDARHARWGDAW